MIASDDVAVVIPAYRATATLRAVLAALEPQVRGPDSTQVLVVDSSADGGTTALTDAFPWLRVIALPQRTHPGAARNIGVATTREQWLAFIDADAIPAPDWLARLRAAGGQLGAVAVAGSISNGTPSSAIGTADYLLEFSELSPHRHGLPVHGASANLLIRRTALEAAGGFAEDTLGEDTILTIPLHRRGQLAFARDARVSHLNRTSLRAVLRHEFALGRAFAVICERVDPPYRVFGRWPLLALAPLLRYLTLLARSVRRPGESREVVRCTLWLALGLAAWTAGVAQARRRLRGDPAHGSAGRWRAARRRRAH